MNATIQIQHPEPLSQEGGARLNWLIAALVLIVAIVMGIVLAAGVQSSGVSTEPSLKGLGELRTPQPRGDRRPDLTWR